MKSSNNELFLASGKVQNTRNLNTLVVRNEETLIEKTVAYNLSYEMEKFLRENFMGKNVDIVLKVNIKRSSRG